MHAMNDQSYSSIIQNFSTHLEKQGKSSYTIVAYKKDLEQFFDYMLANDKTKVSQIRQADIEAFIADLIEEKNYTKKSASRKLNSIRTLFRYLKSQGIIDANPASEINHPKFDTAAPRILTKLEYRGLRDNAKKDVRTYALIELLLQTGMKIGELSELRLEDVKSHTLFIRANGKNIEREIPLNKPASEALHAYLKIRPNFPHPNVFITRSGKPLLIRNIRQIIDRCFAEVDIQNATVNDLRNTFIAHQLTNGASIDYVAKIVGHRRITSTERFLNLVQTDNKKLEKLGEL